MPGRMKRISSYKRIVLYIQCNKEMIIFPKVVFKYKDVAAQKHIWPQITHLLFA
jgi:hypothetical protein